MTGLRTVNMSHRRTSNLGLQWTGQRPSAEAWGGLSPLSQRSASLSESRTVRRLRLTPCCRKMTHPLCSIAGAAACKSTQVCIQCKCDKQWAEDKICGTNYCLLSLKLTSSTNQQCLFPHVVLISLKSWLEGQWVYILTHSISMFHLFSAPDVFLSAVSSILFPPSDERGWILCFHHTQFLFKSSEPEANPQICIPFCLTIYRSCTTLTVVDDLQCWVSLQIIYV